MALRLSAKVVGLDQAKKHLQGLPKAVRNRALRSGFKKIGQIIARDMKRSIPGRGAVGGKSPYLRSGQMKKSIGHRIKLYRSSGNIIVTIGPRGGFVTDIIRTERGVAVKYNPARVFHLVDGGTPWIRPRNYLRQSLNRNRSQLPGLLMVEVRKVITKWQQSQSTKS